MMEELTKAIKQLETLSPRLNEITEQANEVVAHVEGFLNQVCSIGIEAEVHLEHKGLDEPEGWCRDLAYAPVGGKFRIALKEETWGEEDDRHGGMREYYRTTFRAWADLSRSEKLHAVAHLPELVETIAAEAAAVATRAENAEEAMKSANEIEAALAKKSRHPKRPIAPRTPSHATGTPRRRPESTAQRPPT